MAAGVMLLVGGCGGGSDDPPAGAAAPTATVTVTVATTAPAVTTAPAAPASSADEAAIRGVYADFVAAVFGDDPRRACEYLSQAALAELAREAQGSGFGDDCEEVLPGVAALLKGTLGDDIEATVTGLRVRGERAGATVVLVGSRQASEAEQTTFERVDGRWLIGPDDG